ncbi:MAG: DNA polymerase III subunit delta' [Campylobacterota bacterium]|nr:DNA polymerase III subunit delta' [Campylobacterota bacterium]
MKSKLPQSHIYITENIDEYAQQLQEELKPHRCIAYIRDDFLIEDAKAVIAEAYISEEREKFLLLGAKSFNAVSQNSLLKIIEEPPSNIIFILLAPTKSLFLPTIRSRLPMVNLKEHTAIMPLNISLKDLDIQTLFSFVKENEKYKKHELKQLIEQIYHHACINEAVALNKEQLDAFELAYRLVPLNGRSQSILVMLLMTFIPEPRRGY